jgi:hypothetical protein
LETEQVSPVAIIQHVRLRVADAGSVRFRLRAVDGGANESEVVLAIRFGAVPEEPPGDIPPSDP